MPVDTSFYNSAPPKPVNPLEMMSQIQGIQGQQLRNQLMQRTMAGQQAFGSAAQAAMRSDGTIDAAKFQSGFQNNPDGAYAGDAAAQFGLSQQQGATALSTAHIQNAGMQLDRMNNVFSGMLTQAVGPDGKLDPTKLTDTLMDQGFNQAAEAGLDPKTLASEKMSMPTDPGMRAQWLLGHISQNADAISKFKAAYGDNTQTNDGATINSARTSIAQGGTLPSYTMQTSPEFNAQPMAVTDNATGAQTFQTRGNVAANPGQFGAGQSTQLQHQQASAGGTDGGNQANMAADFERANNTGVTQGIHTITASMRAELSSFHPGPGTPFSSKLASLAAQAVQALGGKPDTSSTDAAQAFNKNAAMLLQLQGGSTQTDLKTANQMQANPNVALGAGSLGRLFATIDGNADYGAAKYKAYEAWKAKTPGASGQWSQFDSAFGRKLQSGALPFQFKYMSKAQKDELGNSMSHNDHEQMKADYNNYVGD